MSTRPEARLLAGYELITKAPDPRTAVPAAWARRPGGHDAHGGQPPRRRAGRLRRRRNRLRAQAGEIHVLRASAQNSSGRSLPASVPDRLPASPGHIGRGHRVRQRWDTSAAGPGARPGIASRQDRGDGRPPRAGADVTRIIAARARRRCRFAVSGQTGCAVTIPGMPQRHEPDDRG